MSEEDTRHLEFSRRKLIGSVATVGAAGALSSIGTFAFFSHEEKFTTNELVAGSLDMNIGYSVHYSDWSEDERQDLQIRTWDGDEETTGDQEDLMNGETGLPANTTWLVATTDPDQFLASTQHMAEGTASCQGGTDADDLEKPLISLRDVKPGDFGEVIFDFMLCDNPGLVWLQADLDSAAENGLTEPERADPDEDGDADSTDPSDVELLDAVEVTVLVESSNNNQNEGEAIAFSGSLRDAIYQLNEGNRVGLNGDQSANNNGNRSLNCFSANIDHSVSFAWRVPADHGNEIQTDTVNFDLSFYTEQCRHNVLLEEGTTVLGDFENDLDGWRSSGGNSLERITREQRPAAVETGQYGLSVEINGDPYPMIENERIVQDANFLKNPFLFANVTVGQVSDTFSNVIFQFRLYYASDSTTTPQDRSTQKETSDKKKVRPAVPSALTWNMKPIEERKRANAERLEIIWYPEDHPPNQDPRGRDPGFNYQGSVVFDNIHLSRNREKLGRTNLSNHFKELQFSLGAYRSVNVISRSENEETGEFVFASGSTVPYSYEVLSDDSTRFVVDGVEVQLGDGWDD